MNFLSHQKLNKHLFLQTAAVFVLCLVPQVNAVSFGQEEPCEPPSCTPLPSEAQQPQDDQSFLSLGADIRDEYFLGETIPLTVTLTNTSGEKKRVEGMRMRQYSLRLKKISQVVGESDLIDEKNYDARYKTVEETDESRQTRRSVSRRIKMPLEWRELQPNEALTLDFPSGSFMNRLETGEYRLTITSGTTKEFSTVFTVKYDKEKSVPVFAKLLQSPSDATQNWAVYQLRQNDIASLYQLLNELEQSDSEKLRKWAKYTINRISSSQ